MTKVSIIVPVFNAEGIIQKSIESLLKQTYANKEIIIVDDSSEDDSYTVAKKFEGESVVVLQQANAGAAVARNTGLSHATGDYIQFMDIDDYLSEDKIEKQVDVLTGQKNKVAVCNYISFFEDHELNSLKEPDQSSFIYSSPNPADFLLNLWGGNGRANFIQTNSWLVPRQIIEKSGCWRDYRCPDDDGEFFTRVLLASEGIIFVPGVFNFYKRSGNEGKLSTNKNKKYVQNSLLTIDLKYNYLKKILENELLKRAFARQYLDFAVYAYPQHKVLSAIALKRYKSMKKRIKLPMIGGVFFQSVMAVFGWKTARVLHYHLRER